MEVGAIGMYICLFMGLYFEVFLLISFLEKRPHAKTAAMPARYPSVAILVPCWNKAKTLGATMHSLLALEYPADRLSILIIDDGSTDGTLAAAQEFAGHAQVRILAKENEGSKFSALNFGLKHTDSELVGCLDADSFVAPDALIEMVKKFESDPNIMAVTPAMKVFEPRTLLERMQSVEYIFGVFYRKMFDNLSAINVLPGPFSFYRRDVFEKIGLFRHAHHTEDMEMAFRLHANRMVIANAHTAVVETKVPTTIGGLVRQRVRWSRGFLENSRDYYYMYFNPRFGHLGLFALPFGLLAFVGGLYTAAWGLYGIVKMLLARGIDFWVTGIPPQFHLPHFEWFYLDTSMLSFLVIAVTGLTLVAVVVGSRIAGSRISATSLVTYFALFGLVAPLWLARATWDTLRAKETGWLV
ncbi:MAG TPA: glycosyltransferase [Candidatus Paceibacterota bacterium]|nr:glycosyltransferase [Candidatus Paceibacterota bacterium]